MQEIDIYTLQKRIEELERENAEKDIWIDTLKKRIQVLESGKCTK